MYCPVFSSSSFILRLLSLLISALLFSSEKSVKKNVAAPAVSRFCADLL